MLCLKNGRCIDPKTEKDEILDILIDGDQIIALGKDLSAEQIIDMTGYIVTPGFIDSHVHLREPGYTYKEDIRSGALAGAKGGFTSILALANTNPVIDTCEILDDVLNKMKECPINVYSAAAVSVGFQGQECVDMEKLKQHGALCFSDDGLPLIDRTFTKQCLIKAKELDMPVSFHEEDPQYISLSGINEGVISEQLGIGGASAKAEDVMVKRDCELALETGAKVCFQHISSKVAIEYIRQAKAKGANIWAEATPHHFSLNEEAILKHHTLAKMNPPLRTEEDRLAIIEGLKDGTIEVIASDHAPHTMEEKQREFKKAPSGIIGLETSLSLGIMNLVHTHQLSMMDYLAKMNYNVAKCYNLPTASIEVGNLADITVFSENETWTPTSFISKSQNSPFLNQPLTGKVKLTICKGRIVYQDDSIC